MRSSEGISKVKYQNLSSAAVVIGISQGAAVVIGISQGAAVVIGISQGVVC